MMNLPLCYVFGVNAFFVCAIEPFWWGFLQWVIPLAPRNIPLILSTTHTHPNPRPAHPLDLSQSDDSPIGSFVGPVTGY